MSKTKEKCALLKDVDENTFIRFSQYAYIEDYITANLDILLDFFMIVSTHLVSNETFIDDDDQEAFSLSSSSALNYAQSKSESESKLESTRDLSLFDIFKKNKKKEKTQSKWADKLEDIVSRAEESAAVASWSKKFETWDKFKSQAYVISKLAFQPWNNRKSCEDYTEIFLCHARLYVFADEYDVDSLRDLSLHRLQRTLIEFILNDKWAENIVNLLRYNYSNTTDCSESVDDLRLLVDDALCQIVKTLFSSSEVNRWWIWTLRYEMSNFSSLHLIISSWSATFSTSRMIEETKSKISSAFRLTIWMSICLITSLSVLVNVFIETAARWLFKIFLQFKKVNRWTKMNEQRSRSFEDMMSFWVTMITRQARCLWRRMIVINDFISFCAAANFLKNLIL